jgi:hypothetical protein
MKSDQITRKLAQSFESQLDPLNTNRSNEIDPAHALMIPFL